MTQALSPYRACLALLRASYPNAVIEKETIDAYEGGLRDLDPQAVIDAVSMLVKESKFMPTIAEIREVVAEQTLGLPTPGEAWAEAQARSFGTWEGKKHPLVDEAIQRMGGTWGIKTSENPSITQSQFLKHYNELRNEAVRFFQRTGRTPELPEPPKAQRVIETVAIDGSMEMGFLTASDFDGITRDISA